VRQYSIVIDFILSLVSRAFPGQRQKKPAATFRIGVAAGSFESFMCLVLSRWHLTPKFRLPALPVEEEAVSKGEVIKGARHIG
jgi:hypothetical protein